MTDLEYRIQTRLDWAYEDPHSFGESAFDALRAVLDLCNIWDLLPEYAGISADVRTTVARELGVRDD